MDSRGRKKAGTENKVWGKKKGVKLENIGDFDFTTAPLCDTSRRWKKRGKINSLTFLSSSSDFPPSLQHTRETLLE